jgi:SAM-dependent methyltransferase
MASDPDQILTEADRRKFDDGDDGEFYDQPRFVHHVDEAFRARLTRLYREQLAPGDRVLDLMGSWVSHLPDIDLRVRGHGLNAAELDANDRYDDWFLQDLNAGASLPFDDGAFDAVLNAVSAQYLERPAEVFAAVARVLAPGGVLVVSFSNRMFPTKAVRAWRERDMDGRAALVCAYLDAAGGFDEPTVIREQPGGDPFCAVVARRAAHDP